MRQQQSVQGGPVDSVRILKLRFTLVPPAAVEQDTKPPDYSL